MTELPHPVPDADSLATRASLLARIRNWEDAQSWEEFTQIYSRLIRSVARKAGLSESEAKDVEQDTLLSVARTIHKFESDPQRGTFKSWLFNLIRWRIANHCKRRGPAGALWPEDDTARTGTPVVERVPGPDQLDADWEEEWRKNLFETALARVGRKAKAKHLQIFDLYAKRHWPAAKVARELAVSRMQVYLVAHRITRSIRREVEFLRRNLE